MYSEGGSQWDGDDDDDDDDGRDEEEDEEEGDDSARSLNAAKTAMTTDRSDSGGVGGREERC